MQHGFDWNGDGKVTPEEDALSWKMLEDDMQRRAGNTSGGNNSDIGCCGTCLLWMLAVPAGIIGLIVGISHFLA